MENLMVESLVVLSYLGMALVLLKAVKAFFVSFMARLRRPSAEQQLAQAFAPMFGNDCVVVRNGNEICFVRPQAEVSS